MRIAFVQGGPGLEAVEEQAARLRSLSPDRYQIEPQPTASARQRMVELLDGLRPGDELCLASLELLRLDVGDVAQVLVDVLDRGANLVLLDENQGAVDMAASPETRRLLQSLARLHRRRREAPPTKPPSPGHELLTEIEIEDIRRLAQAGLSPRRIGLIYRRSPKCISDLLWTADDMGARRRA